MLFYLSHVDKPPHSLLPPPPPHLSPPRLYISWTTSECINRHIQADLEEDDEEDEDIEVIKAGSTIQDIAKLSTSEELTEVIFLSNYEESSE